MFERLLSHSIKKDGDKFGEEKAFDEKVRIYNFASKDLMEKRCWKKH